jgi:hypothetical protein
VTFHHMLLRVAGWAPDELVSLAREWLARGHLVEVAQAVTYVALANHIPLTPEDADGLRAALSDADLDTDLLADLDLVELMGMPSFAMAPMYPGLHTDRVDDMPYTLDLTGDADQHDAVDPVDRAIMAEAGTEVAGVPPVVGLWRTWRSPSVPTPWPPPRRLYLVQATPDGQVDLPNLAVRLQRALAAAGEDSPQVEVFARLEDLPPYQRTALGSSALLWTPRPEPLVRIADVFDSVDEVGGPGFMGSRPTLDGRERDDVLAYLDAGSPLLMTTALMDDVVEETRHANVPMSFRTDGRWIWTDAAAYYLRQYGLAPDGQLLDHIRARRFEIPPVDAVAQHRALAALQAQTPDDW